jgi:hypothetical protein
MSKKTKNAEPNRDSADQKQIVLEFRRADTLRPYFTNNVQISAGQTEEVQIFFGQILSPVAGTIPELIPVNQDVGIVMTFDEFKRTAELFSRHLPLLETAFENQRQFRLASEG